MIYFVVNPKAGNGRASKVWNRLEKALRMRNVCFETIITQAACEASVKCRELIEKQRSAESFTDSDAPGERSSAGEAGPVTVVIVGGDGTLNEAIQGMMDAASGEPLGDDVRLSFIPAGSGNDFARGHGIPLDPDKALDQLLEAVRSGRRKRIDVFEANGHFAVSSIGAGLDGQVAYAANVAPYKRWMNRLRLGRAAYILSLLRVLSTYKPTEVEALVDGVPVRISRVWLIAVSNIPQYGGGMLINPGAQPSDGIAEMCVVSGLSRAGLLAAFPKVYSGSHTNHPNVRFFRGCDIRISPLGQMRIHADGENAGLAPVRIRVIPQAVWIMV